jgi:hypothetical protein
MRHEQQQMIAMRSNVREWTHVLLVNTPCLHLHSFCATGVSSGLATRVTLTRVSRGEVGRVYYMGLDLLLIYVLCRSMWLLLGCILNGRSHGFIVGWPPFVDDFAGHPVLPTLLPVRIVNVIVHTLPHPKWHKTECTNLMAMNKQREMRFI